MVPLQSPSSLVSRRTSLLSRALRAAVVASAAALVQSCAHAPALVTPTPIAEPPSRELWITDGLGDEIVFPVDTLVTMRDVSSHVVMNASQALTVLLEDGERLHIDDRTPYGTYVQGPERSIEVTSPLGYPRSFTERGPFWRQFSFRIERVMTGRWIGALTSPPDVSASAEDYLREIPREGWTLPLRDEDRFVAFEYPRDWWPNAAYKLDSRRTSPFKLTWFVYGDPLPRPEPRNGLVRTEHGVRFDPMLADFAFGGPRWPEAAYWTAPGDAAKLHVVGAVLVDPRTGRIRATTP